MGLRRVRPTPRSMQQRRGGCSLVDEHQLLRVEVGLALEPCLALRQDVGRPCSQACAKLLPGLTPVVTLLRLGREEVSDGIRIMNERALWVWGLVTLLTCALTAGCSSSSGGGSGSKPNNTYIILPSGETVPAQTTTTPPPR
jgi:hypothetical protein